MSVGLQTLKMAKVQVGGMEHKALLNSGPWESTLLKSCFEKHQRTYSPLSGFLSRDPLQLDMILCLYDDQMHIFVERRSLSFIRFSETQGETGSVQP